MIAGSLITYALLSASVHRTVMGGRSDRGADPVAAIPVLPGIMVIAGGLALFAGGLFYGVWRDRHENIGPRRSIEGASVVARYALTSEGIYMTDPVEIENADRPRFHVRLTMPGEGSIELNTSEETFWWAGEGMVGTAELTGKWLARFTPDMGAGTGHASTVV